MVGFGPADLGSNPSRATIHIRNFINRLRFDSNMAIQNIAVLGAGQWGMELHKLRQLPVTM